MHMIPLSSRTLPSNAASLLHMLMFLSSDILESSFCFLSLSYLDEYLKMPLIDVSSEIWGPIVGEGAIVGSEKGIGAKLGLPWHPQLGRA